MGESELEKKFRERVTQAGGKAYKFVSPGNAGVPDRLVILPGGKIGFVELKQEGGKPRKLQQFRMKELEGLGCFTAVVDSIESAEAAIAGMVMQAPQTHSRDRLFLEMVNRSPGGKEGCRCEIHTAQLPEILHHQNYSG